MPFYMVAWIKVTLGLWVRRLFKVWIARQLPIFWGCFAHAVVDATVSCISLRRTVCWVINSIPIALLGVVEFSLKRANCVKTDKPIEMPCEGR